MSASLECHAMEEDHYYSSQPILEASVDGEEFDGLEGVTEGMAAGKQNVETDLIEEVGSEDEEMVLKVTVESISTEAKASDPPVFIDSKGMKKVAMDSVLVNMAKSAENAKKSKKYRTLGGRFRRVNSKLPILEHRKKILELISDHTVTCIEGETSCGKSTMVPQFILDESLNQSEPQYCSVSITQPRRVAAIKLAERVAAARQEPVGKSIGYCVGGDIYCAPHTKVTYDTIGYFLQVVVHNPSTIQSYTHIILDEVHERSMDTDFAMLVFRRLLSTRQRTEIILMSATLQGDMLTKYFEETFHFSLVSSPYFVGAKRYPVKQCFYDDLSDLADNCTSPDKKSYQFLKNASEVQTMLCAPPKMNPCDIYATTTAEYSGSVYRKWLLNTCSVSLDILNRLSFNFFGKYPKNFSLFVRKYVSMVQVTQENSFDHNCLPSFMKTSESDDGVGSVSSHNDRQVPGSLDLNCVSNSDMSLATASHFEDEVSSVVSTVPLVSHEDPTVPLVSQEQPTVPLVSHEDPTVPLVSQEHPTVPLVSHEDLTVPLVSQEHPTVPLVSQEHPTIPLVGQEHSTVPLVSQEHPTVPLLSQEHPTVPLVSQEHPTVPLVSQEHPTVPLVSQEHPSVPLVSQEHPTVPLVSQEHPTVPLVSQEDPTVPLVSQESGMDSQDPTTSYHLSIITQNTDSLPVDSSLDGNKYGAIYCSSLEKSLPDKVVLNSNHSSRSQGSSVSEGLSIGDSVCSGKHQDTGKVMEELCCLVHSDNLESNYNAMDCQKKEIYSSDISEDILSLQKGESVDFSDASAILPSRRFGDSEVLSGSEEYDRNSQSAPDPNTESHSWPDLIENESFLNRNADVLPCDGDIERTGHSGRTCFFACGSLKSAASWPGVEQQVLVAKSTSSEIHPSVQTCLDVDVSSSDAATRVEEAWSADHTNGIKMPKAQDNNSSSDHKEHTTPTKLYHSKSSSSNSLPDRKWYIPPQRRKIAQYTEQQFAAVLECMKRILKDGPLTFHSILAQYRNNFPNYPCLSRKYFYSNPQHYTCMVSSRNNLLVSLCVNSATGFSSIQTKKQQPPAGSSTSRKSSQSTSPLSPVEVVPSAEQDRKIVLREVSKVIQQNKGNRIRCSQVRRRISIVLQPSERLDRRFFERHSSLFEIEEIRCKRKGDENDFFVSLVTQNIVSSHPYPEHSHSGKPRGNETRSRFQSRRGQGGAVRDDSEVSTAHGEGSACVPKSSESKAKGGASNHGEDKKKKKKKKHKIEHFQERVASKDVSRRYGPRGRGGYRGEPLYVYGSGLPFYYSIAESDSEL